MPPSSIVGSSTAAANFFNRHSTCTPGSNSKERRMMFRSGYVYSDVTLCQANTPALRLHSRRTYYILSFVETLQARPRVQLSRMLGLPCAIIHLLMRRTTWPRKYIRYYRREYHGCRCRGSKALETADSCFVKARRIDKSARLLAHVSASA